MAEIYEALDQSPRAIPGAAAACSEAWTLSLGISLIFAFSTHRSPAARGIRNWRWPCWLEMVAPSRKTRQIIDDGSRTSVMPSSVARGCALSLSVRINLELRDQPAQVDRHLCKCARRLL